MRKLQRQVELRGIEWGGPFSPLSDLLFAFLVRRCWIEYEYIAELGFVEVIWPPAFGAHQMSLSADLSIDARRFACRHGMAHVLAGHTVGPAHDAGWSSWDETLADLFALLDVIPDHRIEELRAEGLNEAELERWVYAEVARWTCGWWPPERLAERVKLRLIGAPPS